MEKFNVVVERDGFVTAVSRAPLRHGISLGCRAYQVEAVDREDAKLKAKMRRSMDEKSDDACWQSK